MAAKSISVTRTLSLLLVFFFFNCLLLLRYVHRDMVNGVVGNELIAPGLPGDSKITGSVWKADESRKQVKRKSTRYSVQGKRSMHENHYKNKEILRSIRGQIEVEPSTNDFDEVKPNDSEFGDQNFIINKPNICDSSKDMLAIIIITSRPGNVASRQAIRTTWGADILRQNSSLAVVFFVSQSNSDGERLGLRTEDQTYGDIIQTKAKAASSHGNRTYLIRRLLLWLQLHCTDTKFVLKTDDRTFINPRNFIQALERSRESNFAAGIPIVWDSPERDPRRWRYVSRDIWSEDTYPPYLRGPSYLWSRDTARQLYSASIDKDNFPVEDIYLGILLEKSTTFLTKYRDMDISGKVQQYCEFQDLILSGDRHPDEIRFLWRQLQTTKDMHCANNADMNLKKELLHEGLLINNPSSCLESEERHGVFLLILVTSSVENSQQRQSIRNTWGKAKDIEDKPIAVLFLVDTYGSNEVDGVDGKETDTLLQENQQSSDILHFHYNTSQPDRRERFLSALQWAQLYCAGANFVVTTADDVLVHAKNIISYLSSLQINEVAMGDFKTSETEKTIFDIDADYNRTYIMSANVVKTLSDIRGAWDFSENNAQKNFVQQLLIEAGVKTTHHDGFDTYGTKRKLCDLDKVMTSGGFHGDLLKYWSGIQLWLDFAHCPGRVSSSEPDSDIPYIIQHDNVCDDFLRSNNSLHVLFGIVSAPLNYVHRMAIRQTWAGMTETNVPGVNVKAVFLLGRARSPSVQERILKENDKYKDIVQQDFAEHYRNLTRKTILLLNWAADYCAGAHYVIKIDDDVFLNTKNMLEFLRQAPRTGLYLGDAKIDTEPLRDAWSKWYTPEEAWPAHVYPPYNNGPAYVMSMDVVRIAKTASKKHVIFPWEDVYVGNLLLNTTISPLPHHSFDTNDIFRDPCSLAVGLASHHFTPQMHYKFWNQLKSCRKNRYNCCKKQQGYKRESPRLPANMLETSIYDPTAYLRQTCNQGDHQTGIRLLILVMSSSQRYETRRFARLTWTNLDTDNGRKVATFFVVGKSAKPHINRFIENENFVYRDILQIDMRDKTSRRYLNIKELLAIKVTAEICHSVPHVMVISDDVFVNFRNVIDFLEKYPHSKLNLKGGHFCYDENCTCISDPRGRSLKSVNDQNVYDDGDYNEGVDGGVDKGTQQQTMSSLSSIFLLNNDTTALIAQSLRRLKKIPTNLYLEKMLERVGKDISTHPGLDVVGTSMGGDGLDSDQNKATVCWLHKTMASKTFVQSTMALIARKLHDGDYFQCHGNDFKPDVLAVYDCDRGVYARTGQKWQQIQEPIVSVKTSADIIINHPEKCQRKNGLKKNIFMLIVVMSSPEDQDYRAAIRATWGNTANEIKEDIVVLFMMGASMNAAQQFEILREDGMFGDIIQGNFPDNFHNQTSKTLTMVKWANTYCEGAKYVMKVRSDMFVNVHKLVNFLSHPPPHLRSGWAIGRLLVDMHPIRDPHHKYYTSLDVYPDDTFPPYLGATCYVMTSDVVHKVRQILPPSATFPWEDVYMGMLLQKVGVELLDHAFFSGGSILDNLLPCEMQLYFSWRVREPLSTYNYQEELQNTDIAACPSEKYNDVTRIEFKIRPNDKAGTCIGNYDVVFVVFSTASRVSRRKAIRETWGQYYEQFDGKRSKTIFLLGTDLSADSNQAQIDQESRRYGDILQGYFTESYDNLSWKTLMAIKWVKLFCQNVQYVMKVDDDVFINTPLLMTSLQNLTPERVYMGFTYVGMMPVRDQTNRNYEPRDMWPERPYPPYNAGPAYVMSKDFALSIYGAAKYVHRLLNEDVYIGTIAQNLGMTPKHDERFDVLGVNRHRCEIKDTVAVHHSDPVQLYKLWYHTREEVKCTANQHRVIDFNFLKGKTINIDFDLKPRLVEESKTLPCPSNTFLIVVIKSSPRNTEARAAIRKHLSRLHFESTIMVIFAVPKITNRQVLTAVDREMRQHNDMVKIDILDSLENATRIFVTELQWSVKYCQSSTFVLFINDGTLVNFSNLMKYLYKQRYKNFAAGYVISDGKPDRTPSSDQYTPIDLYPSSTYPRYLKGPPYLFSTDVAKRLSSASKSASLFIWEDIYLGKLIQKLKIEVKNTTDFDVEGFSRADSECSLKDMITSNYFTATQLSNAWRTLTQICTNS